MSETSINNYGDQRIQTNTGHGVDIATQRADDLDLAAIAHIESIKPDVKQGRAHVLEIGCGFGGQAVRMAKAGAKVLATDLEDYSEHVAQLSSDVSEGSVDFLQAKIEDLSQVLGCTERFDVVMCQRMIHYLPWAAAVASLRSLRSVAKHGGRLFISASGLLSELGQGYEGKDVAIPERFHRLEEAMATKHAIFPRVCLYTEAEMIALLTETGWEPVKVFSSPFGNIKAIAILP
jgi:SAM-dependent methyltransferase